MTLIEAFVRDEIILNPYEEPIYGEDQCCICYPERFATVSLALRATNGLIQIADRIRTDLGFRPMHPMDEYDGDSCDNEGWYDFYVGLNGHTDNHVDSCIEFIVVNSDSEDNECVYAIELTIEEKAAVYSCLDEQCLYCFGQSCEELLAEAEKEMEEDEIEDYQEGRERGPVRQKENPGCD